MQQFVGELKGWVQGKGSVQLPLDLIQRIALFRGATVTGSQPVANTKNKQQKVPPKRHRLPEKKSDRGDSPRKSHKGSEEIHRQLKTTDGPELNTRCQ